MKDEGRRVLLGRITGAHGIRGDVVVASFTREPGDVAGYGPLATEDGRKIELKVVRITAKGVIARIAGVSDRTGAEALKGLALYLARERLPAAGDGEFYHADLVGLRVEDAHGKLIGTVESVANYGAGDILELRLAGKSATELIPFTETFVPLVDVVAGRLVVDLPIAADDEDNGKEEGD